jgi:hypothetical protein
MYAVWGEEEDREAWRSIYWKAREYSPREDEDNMLGRRDVPVLRDNGNGYISHGNYSYFLKMNDSPGDGTVPDVSAQDQKRAAKVSFIHGNRSGLNNMRKGWEHQDCCCDDRVKWATVYSIIKIVSATKP